MKKFGDLRQRYAIQYQQSVPGVDKLFQGWKRVLVGEGVHDEGVLVRFSMERVLLFG